jgi:plastocyanin
MKKYVPFILVIVVIVAIATVALANKDTKTAAPPPAPAPTNSSNQSTNNPNPNPTPPSSESSTEKKVSIVNMDYSPADVTVKKGTKVTWTNNDDVAHTVTADSGNAFDSGNMNKSTSFSHTFDTVGTFAYHCTFHSNMHGKITVTE